MVEIDGEIHNQQKEYDIGRTAEMERYNISVIRFKNSEIETDVEKVVIEIERAVNQLLKSPPWGI